MIPLPVGTDDPNIQQLARWGRETQSGITGATLTLEARPLEGLEQIFKNGLLLVGSAYTMSGKTITFSVALIATDVIVAYYHQAPY